MERHGLGSYIRGLREERGWSQTRLAAELGVSRAYMSQLESGKTILPSVEIRRRLATIFGVPHTELLVRAGELNPEELASGNERRNNFPNPRDFLSGLVGPDARVSIRRYDMMTEVHVSLTKLTEEDLLVVQRIVGALAADTQWPKGRSFRGRLTPVPDPEPE